MEKPPERPHSAENIPHYRITLDGSGSKELEWNLHELNQIDVSLSNMLDAISIEFPGVPPELISIRPDGYDHELLSVTGPAVDNGS